MNRVLFSAQVVLVVALAGSVLEFEDAGGSCTITKVAGALQSSCTLTDPARLNFEQSVSTRLDDLEALTVGFSDRIDDLEAAVDQVSTPALTDKDTVSLIDYETGAKLEWSGASGRINGAASVGSSQWRLKKCVFGDCSTGALGSASQWTSAGSDASELKTCDVVAWFSTNSHRVYDCACTSQSYPLPSGNWGSPYKIRKQGHACGQPIKNHDEIYFSRMYSGVFVDSYYLACTTGQCRGTTDGTKTSFSIVRQEVMPTLSDKDTVTLRDSSNNYLEWSGGSGRVNIVASASSRQWQMKKCASGSCSAGALGSASQWTTAGSDASDSRPAMSSLGSARTAIACTTVLGVPAPANLTRSLVATGAPRTRSAKWVKPAASLSRIMMRFTSRACTQAFSSTHTTLPAPLVNAGAPLTARKPFSASQTLLFETPAASRCAVCRPKHLAPP
jgi:hypothetical protein